VLRMRKEGRGKQIESACRESERKAGHPGASSAGRASTLKDQAGASGPPTRAEGVLAGLRGQRQTKRHGGPKLDGWTSWPVRATSALPRGGRRKRLPADGCKKRRGQGTDFDKRHAKFLEPVHLGRRDALVTRHVGQVGRKGLGWGEERGASNGGGTEAEMRAERASKTMSLASPSLDEARQGGCKTHLDTFGRAGHRRWAVDRSPRGGTKREASPREEGCGWRSGCSPRRLSLLVRPRRQLAADGHPSRTSLFSRTLDPAVAARTTDRRSRPR
jgi:hypothetical protein